MKKENIAAALIFFAALTVYILSLNPVFHANDSPETAACAYTLGIQHPPGYPLPALIGKIFTLIPAGSVGFRVNLSAAVFAALAAALFFLLLFETLRSGRENEIPALAASAAAAMALAFSPTLWQEALSSKGGIYTLNAFMLVSVVFALFKWEKTQQIKYLYLAVFAYGVSLANHWESMAVAAPAIMLFAFLTLNRSGLYKTITAKNIFFMAVFLSAGIFIYAYLLIRSKAAILNWGRPDTFAQLIQVILREQYADLEKARSLGTVAKQTARAGSLILSEFSAAGLMLAAAGVIPAFAAGKKQRFVFFGALALTIIAALTFYFNLKEEMLWIMDVFMIPVYIVMAAFCGAAIKSGIDFLVKIPNKEAAQVRNADSGIRNQRQKPEQILTPDPGPRTPDWRNYAVILLAAILPTLMLINNYRAADQSRYFYAYDFGMNIIKSIEEPALAMMDGDFNVMPQMYFRYVDKKTGFCPVTTLFLYKPWGVLNQLAECPDVKFTSGQNDSFSSKINNIVALNYRERNIYVSVFRKSWEEFYPEGNRMLVPAGMVMKLTSDKRGTVKSAEVNLKKASFRGLLGEKRSQNSTTKLCVSNYSSAFMELGNAFKELGDFKKAFYYMYRAVLLANEKTLAQSYTHLAILYSAAGDNNTALEVYEKAIKADKKLPEPYSNMSGIYNSMQKYDEAIKYAEEAIRQKPEFSEAYNNMAIAYYNKGDKAKAVELMEKSVKLNPANELAKRNLMIIKGEMK